LLNNTSHPCTALVLLNKIQVYCLNRVGGCDWKGGRVDLEDHCLKTCAHHQCRNVAANINCK
jgi:hypothetical protein